MKQKIAIGILTYRRPDLLRDLIESVKAQRVGFDKVIIFDNDPLGSAKNIVSNMLSGFVEYDYVVTDENIGSSGGFNKLFARARDDNSLSHFVCSDDDIELSENFLEELLAVSSVNPSSIVIGGRKYISGSSFNWAPVISYKHPARVFFHASDEECALINIDLITFEGCMFPIGVIKTIGLPLQEFFMDGDDWEYGLRAKKFGFNILKIPSINVIRKIEPSVKIIKLPFFGKKFSRPNISPARSYYEVRNKFKISYLYAPNFVYSLSLEMLNGIRRIIGILLFDKNKLERIKCVFLGVVHGLFGVNGKYY